MSSNRGPKPLSVAWSLFRARRVSKPRPLDLGESADHDALAVELEELRRGGIAVLPGRRRHLRGYRDYLQDRNPDGMGREDALAYWLNLYNSGALDLAAQAAAAQVSSVLRVPGAFDEPWAAVAGESLSLTDIEHGKIRRFRDPRIHSALVCGSASCPSLRLEPYHGAKLDAQLDDQMQNFLRVGAAVADKAKDVLRLSRVFLWYGGDFTRPHRMPTWLPAGRRSLTEALTPWMDPDVAAWIGSARPKVEFRPYNWELACAVG